MTLDTFFEKFELFADAPDAVAKMRGLVLNLAVQGKLVPQDPNDEPATELLKRLEKEKTRFVKEGKIKKQEELPPTEKDELPFKAPDHWIWLRLKRIGTISGGMTPSMNRADFWGGDINWFSPKDFGANELDESILKITDNGLNETRLQLYPQGCLFMVARSGILKRTFPVAINRVKATANQDLKVLNPFIKGSERYYQIMFRGLETFILTHLVKTGTTVQSLKYSEFELQPFPIPPLAEQRRIVEKVDALMALVDTLETQIATARAAATALLEAAVAELTTKD